MKILLVTPTYKDSYPPRGLSMGSAVKQSEQLSKLHKVVVLTSGREKTIDLVSPNLTIFSESGFLLPDPVNYVICFPLLIKFIKLALKFKPDVVMVSKFMFFSSFVIPIAKVMGLKVVTTTDTFPGINWFPRSKIVGAIMWLYARLIGLPLLWLSDRVILLYTGLKPIADRYHLKSIVIPNGVEPCLLGSLPKPKDLKKPKGEFWVGFVGRAESIKGYDIALETADLLTKHAKIKFVFIGGNQKQTSSGNKIFLGFRSDIYNLYQLLDILILPSFSEGLPNVVMEAMAQGSVVIANPVGGVNDLIIDNKTGLLVKQNTPQEFANQISNISKNASLRSKLSFRGKEFIRKNYSWSKSLSGYSYII